MTRDHAPDPDVNAARIVAESTRDERALPADLEAAWAEWSRGSRQGGRAGMTLLSAVHRNAVIAIVQLT